METSEEFSTFRNITRAITITDYIPQPEQPVVTSLVPWENRL